MWEGFEVDDRQRLLDVMEQFDLICRVPVIQEQDKQATGYKEPIDTTSQGRNYYVPSLFNPKIVNKEAKLESSTSVTFFVDVEGSFTGEHYY